MVYKQEVGVLEYDNVYVVQNDNGEEQKDWTCGGGGDHGGDHDDHDDLDDFHDGDHDDFHGDHDDFHDYESHFFEFQIHSFATVEVCIEKY